MQAEGCSWQWIQIGNKAYWCCVKSGGGSWCDPKGIQIPDTGSSELRRPRTIAGSRAVFNPTMGPRRYAAIQNPGAQAAAWARRGY
jgi:hypothetical protein